MCVHVYVHVYVYVNVDVDVYMHMHMYMHMGRASVSRWQRQPVNALKLDVGWSAPNQN